MEPYPWLRVDAGLLNASEKGYAADLSDELAECAIQRFSEANFSRINNKNGFLMGIIRRVKTDGPDRNSGDLESLPRPLRYKLQDLIDDVSLNIIFKRLTAPFWVQTVLQVEVLSPCMKGPTEVTQLHRDCRLL